MMQLLSFKEVIVSEGTERGWVGRIPVPQTGFPCGTTLVSVGTLVSIVSIVSVVSVLKKTYPCKHPVWRTGIDLSGIPACRRVAIAPDMLGHISNPIYRAHAASKSSNASIVLAQAAERALMTSKWSTPGNTIKVAWSLAVLAASAYD